ncbi:hypothetical protein AUI46_04255 [archaeon 13_1_40CM_2_52_13]|nr:MAG: hypothetical protein AUI46_04255 [archaeon 13_1_40CM_2_52_13]OLE69361.1 MAG: hypothetical protein AUF78_11440 [archaeon 13_1_20CM_2_51_12]
MTDFKKSLGENRKRLEKNDSMPHDVMADLLDSSNQSGVRWRSAKINAILSCREAGRTDEWILEALLRSGTTIAKSRELMKTALKIEALNKTTGYNYEPPAEKDFRE